MKIIAMSDGHGNLPEVEGECDVFIHAGDICPATNHTRPFQANWLAEKFNPWLRSIRAQHKIVIAGNHDWIFYDAKHLLPKLDCTYLEGDGVEIDGVKFWGSPWTPWFLDWAFNFPRVDGLNDAIPHWHKIPAGTDVVITHGPPRDYGDVLPGGGKPLKGYPDNRTRVGCPHLRNRLMEVQPKLHIFGHIHEGGGDNPICEYQHASGRVTKFCNVSVLDEQYVMTKKPTVLEL